MATMLIKIFIFIKFSFQINIPHKCNFNRLYLRLVLKMDISLGYNSRSKLSPNNVVYLRGLNNFCETRINAYLYKNYIFQIMLTTNIVSAYFTGFVQCNI